MYIALLLAPLDFDLRTAGASWQERLIEACFLDYGVMRAAWSMRVEPGKGPADPDIQCNRKLFGAWKRL